MKIHPIILAGGFGHRLWPLSREKNPKTFLELEEGTNLLQKTISYISDINIFHQPIISSNAKHQWLIEQSLSNLKNRYKLILEPCSRNTGPAILSALIDIEQNTDDLVLILPIDNYINTPEIFIQNILEIQEIAKKHIVVFGTKFKKFSPDYGYIKKTDTEIHPKVYEIDDFIEKPKQETEIDFGKKYFRNFGVIFSKGSLVLNSIHAIDKNLFQNIKLSVDNSQKQNNCTSLCYNDYSKCNNISIDKLLLEKSEKVVVSEINPKFFDAGNFQHLYENSNENKIEGRGVALESDNCYINSPDLFTAILGIKDIAVISTKDSILVVDKKKVNKINNVTKFLKENPNKYKKELEGDTEYRPWGYFINLFEDTGYKIKKIIVNPNGKLSLQSHKHRSEQWTVIEGTAYVTIGQKKFKLLKGESAHIPMNEKHRLENKGISKLEIIEIQLGVYLGEDDITRYEDIYQRVTYLAHPNE
ncbi:MAG: mannose-1-phosphate guanylyltransferase/mannose-6-phosphate isomerase [Candidatus Midichloriaceae bacterium]|jgi:mannose-1-phosphate guanylyltransferase/mannose-6-phosphate isomerase